MGIKYKHTRYIEQAREARGPRIDPAPPRLRVNPRNRLLIIYSGILLFCAFVLVGQLYQRASKAWHPQQARCEAVLTRLNPETWQATLQVALPEGGTLELPAQLSAEHQALREGQRVGALLQRSNDTWRVADVSRFALSAKPAIDSSEASPVPRRDAAAQPEASDS
ncbi:MAG: hypothetical protein GC168_08065 [Candidatus Hydrogenedens sp.]|nr:hypothetical protein [Candidatus Hydrogenedens sp.]